MPIRPAETRAHVAQHDHRNEPRMDLNGREEAVFEAVLDDEPLQRVALQRRRDYPKKPFLATNVAKIVAAPASFG
jgi:hypothetical protein